MSNVSDLNLNQIYQQATGQSVTALQSRAAPAEILQSIPNRRWKGSFLNLSRQNLDSYESYNFDQPDAIYDLGDRGKSRRTIAQLHLDMGTGSLDGVQNDYFAMQAQTRIRLRSGKFYKITSQSDDGTRFWFDSARTGERLGEFNDNWSDRNTDDAPWTQVIAATAGGPIDMFMQYYEKRGTAVADVTIEKFRPIAEVAAESGINLRSQASTLNNSPLDILEPGEKFRIARQVKSPDDTLYPYWYRIVTQDRQRGYVSADDRLVSLVDGTSIVPLKGDLPEPIIAPPSDAPAKAFISSKVWITSDDRISLRSDKSLSGLELARLGENTPVTVLEKVTGESYLNGYDQWYRVQVDLSGQSQEGYVAAYYVEVPGIPGSFNTAISKENVFYKRHLNEVTNPSYFWTSYKPMIEQVAARYDWLSPSVVAGIGSRESAWGLLLSPPGPAGTGDGGHGRGLMQIDDRYHQDFINSGQWRDPQASLDYAIDQVLSRNYNYLDANTNLEGVELLRGAIAAYNSGLTNVLNALGAGYDVDYYTTGDDYSWDVLNRAGWFQQHGWV
jgi:hypothetical protein